MDINQKNLLPKEFLRRENIKTMKKDLQRLKEADAVQESRKIIGIDVFKKESGNKQPETLADDFLTENTQISNKNIAGGEKVSTLYKSPIAQFVLGENSENRSIAMASNDRGADKIPAMSVPASEIPVQAGRQGQTEEVEKQKTFLFKLWRSDADHKIKGINKKIQHILSEKNRIISVQQKWQDIIARLDQELQEYAIQEQSAGSGEYSDQGKDLNRKQQWQEEQKKRTEKKQWHAQRQFLALENNIKSFYKKYEELQREKDRLSVGSKIADASLQSLQETSLKKEALSNPLPKEDPPSFYAKDTAPQAVSPHMVVGSQANQEAGRNLHWQAEITKTAKEKLDQATQVEQEQRRKFMEDVEQWANSKE